LQLNRVSLGPLKRTKGFHLGTQQARQRHEREAERADEEQRLKENAEAVASGAQRALAAAQVTWPIEFEGRIAIEIPIEMPVEC
jgi:hypothetical protein